MFMIFIGAVSVTALSVLLSGWALTILWAWFVVPVFGLPQIAIAQAIGILIVASMLTHQMDTNKHEIKGYGELLIGAMLRPIFAIFFGYIITLFM